MVEYYITFGQTVRIFGQMGRSNHFGSGLD